MKITITFRDMQQTSPDDYQNITRVIHLKENMTLKDVHEKLGMEKFKRKEFDGEIHFNDENN